MPKFSIVIPTHARPDTLAHALRTAVEQSFEDVEILVHESGDDPRVAETVARAGDHRTRFRSTGRIVSMPENWERALDCTTGEYITFIGDDDGLVPDACATVSEILEKTPADIVSWRPAAYYWPQYVNDRLRNRLQALLTEPDVLELKSSRIMLELVYRFRADYSRLPMIYNSFVSRALVDRVKNKTGRYFLGGSPDVSSGILNALFCDSYLFSGRPLSVSGLSHHSTGHRIYFSEDASLREAAEAAAALEPAIHPTLIRSRNFHIAIGNEMLLVKEQVFPNEAPAFSHKGLLYSALQGMQYGPDPASSLADIQEVARKNGIGWEDFPVPLKSAEARPPALGVQAIDSSSLTLDIDCKLACITDVRDAARLLAALAPPCPDRRIVHAEPALRRVRMAFGHPFEIVFSRHGNGFAFLGFGWGDLESWGVWTLGRRAEIVLPLERPAFRRMRVNIVGHTFVNSRFPTAAGSIVLNGKRVAKFSATNRRPNIDIQLKVGPECVVGGEIRLEFEIDSPRRPADFGLSSDMRQLGLGLKQIVIRT